MSEYPWDFENMMLGQHTQPCDCAICDEIHAARDRRKRSRKMKNPELTEMEIAAAAYTEYSRITGGKSLATGRPLPLWCDLPDNIRYAWHGTIYKVVCLVLNQDEILTTYHDSIIAENKKLNDALEIIAHMGISGMSWQYDYEKCVNIAKEALEI